MTLDICIWDWPKTSVTPKINVEIVGVSQSRNYLYPIFKENICISS